jgi:ATP-dependent exoDNAse (exonuclease V) beta subunit
VLADLTCRMNRDEASRYLDAGRRLCAIKLAGWAPHDLHEHQHEEVSRDRAEGVRLAYVAATRARDVLVVPVIGDEPWQGGWLDPLMPAIYPPPGARQSPRRGAGCPAPKSKDSLVARPEDRQADARTVAPGLHVFDGYTVLWCDPRWLAPLGLEPTFGVRGQDVVVRDVKRDVVDERRAAYDRWKASREAARSRGGVPSRSVATVREVADRDPSGGEDVAVLSLGRGARARGPAFGTLVHAVLADVPLDARAEAVGGVAARLGRTLGLADGDIEEAAELVRHALTQPFFDRVRAAATAGRCRRETPITVVVDDQLVEGIVDLAFEEEGRWVVVDYKTDAELSAEGEARYRRQVALYASAIGQATGQPARAVLVRL